MNNKDEQKKNKQNQMEKMLTKIKITKIARKGVDEKNQSKTKDEMIK